MKDEFQNILNAPYRDKGAYKVPEGYFDTLSDRILAKRLTAVAGGSSVGDAAGTVVGAAGMAAGSEPRKPGTIVALKRTWYYIAAACVALAVIFTAASPYMMRESESGMVAKVAEDTSVGYSDQYTQDCYEYAMVDADDAYGYIMEN